MRYVSARAARGRDDPQPFCAILLEGLAPDGGLAVPQAYPRFTPAELAALRPLGYRELAFAVLSRFIDDIPAADLQAHHRPHVHAGDVRQRRDHAARDARAGPPPAARVERPDARVQGHRAAAAGQPVRVRAGARPAARLNILGATSGDTGSSAEYAMRGKRGITVFMLSPQGRMSPFQQAQMFSLADPNIHNLAIDGMFDDCQDIVKAVASDAAFKARYAIGAVNSINWARDRRAGRLLLQGLLRRDARRRASRSTSPCRRAISATSSPAHVAQRDGPADPAADPRHQRERRARRVLPHRPLPAARRSRDARDVVSPSMDISKASNFERFVFDVVGRDPAVAARAVGDSSAPTAASISSRHAALGAASQASGFVSGTQHARRPHRDDPRHRDALRRRHRSAHGRRRQGRPRACATRRAAGLHRDGAAGQVRGDDPRGARARPGAAGRLRRPRVAAAAQHDAARRCRRASRRSSRSTPRLRDRAPRRLPASTSCRRPCATP